MMETSRWSWSARQYMASTATSKSIILAGSMERGLVAVVVPAIGSWSEVVATEDGCLSKRALTTPPPNSRGSGENTTKIQILF